MSSPGGRRTSSRRRPPASASRQWRRCCSGAWDCSAEQTLWLAVPRWTRPRPATTKASHHSHLSFRCDRPYAAGRIMTEVVQARAPTHQKTPFGPRNDAAPNGHHSRVIQTSSSPRTVSSARPGPVQDDEALPSLRHGLGVSPRPSSSASTAYPMSARPCAGRSEFCARWPLLRT